jgi:hypothetical protein
VGGFTGLLVGFGAWVGFGVSALVGLSVGCLEGSGAKNVVSKKAPLPSTPGLAAFPVESEIEVSWFPAPTCKSPSWLIADALLRDIAARTSCWKRNLMLTQSNRASLKQEKRNACQASRPK